MYNAFDRRVIGFTLIELMIAVAIVAILAAFAYPSYNTHIRKTERKAAVGKILEIAGRLEQYRTQTFSYPADGALDQFDLTEKRYSYVVTTPDAGDSFEIAATPNTGTDQVNDKCGKLEYDSEGVWTFNEGTTLTETDCL